MEVSAKQQDEPEMLWVMGPVLAVILIIIIVIAILLFKRWMTIPEHTEIYGIVLYQGQGHDLPYSECFPGGILRYTKYNKWPTQGHNPMHSVLFSLRCKSSVHNEKIQVELGGGYELTFTKLWISLCTGTAYPRNKLELSPAPRSTDRRGLVQLHQFLWLGLCKRILTWQFLPHLSLF